MCCENVYISDMVSRRVSFMISSYELYSQHGLSESQHGLSQSPQGLVLQPTWAVLEPDFFFSNKCCDEHIIVSYHRDLRQCFPNSQHHTPNCASEPSSSKGTTSQYPRQPTWAVLEPDVTLDGQHGLSMSHQMSHQMPHEMSHQMSHQIMRCNYQLLGSLAEIIFIIIIVVIWVMGSPLLMFA